MLHTGARNVASTKARVALSMGSPVKESFWIAYRYAAAWPELFIMR